MTQSLYERIGGDEAVYAAVNKMYDKVLSDTALAPFFEHTDVKALRASQTAFVIYAFGGDQQSAINRKLRMEGKMPSQGYSKNYLRAAHSGAVSHGLSDRHFDLVANHLKAAMQELDVPQELISESMRIISTTRQDILNK